MHIYYASLTRVVFQLGIQEFNSREVFVLENFEHERLSISNEPSNLFFHESLVKTIHKSKTRPTSRLLLHTVCHLIQAMPFFYSILAPPIASHHFIDFLTKRSREKKHKHSISWDILKNCLDEHFFASLGKPFLTPCQYTLAYSLNNGL